VLEGALILLAGILLGRFLPGRRRAPKLPEAVCGCKHHYSMHDPATGLCHSTDEEPSAYDSYGIAREWRRVSCTCRRYAGPEFLPQYLAPEIAEG
jgi:hypothetical protein